MIMDKSGQGFIDRSVYKTMMTLHQMDLIRSHADLPNKLNCSRLNQLLAVDGQFEVKSELFSGFPAHNHAL